MGIPDYLTCLLRNLYAGQEETVRTGHGTIDWLQIEKGLCQNIWLCGSQQTVKILKEMGIPDHLAYLLRNLYTGQEVIVRTGHGTAEWFQIGKGVRQGCIWLPCLFNVYAAHIMWNAGLDEVQAGIKITRRNINNLGYADDTTLMAEKKELKSLLMKVKEEG